MTLLTLALAGSTAGSKFTFNFDASFHGNTVGVGNLVVGVDFQIVIDGVPQPAAGVVTTAGFSALAGTQALPGCAALSLEVPNPGAGAHTILVQWKVNVNTTTTAVIDPTTLGNGEHASLTMMETTV